MITSSNNLVIRLSPDEDSVADVLLGPACRLCGGVSRLTGIEPHPYSDHVDLRTYECVQCGHPFTIDVPLRGLGKDPEGANQNDPQG